MKKKQRPPMDYRDIIVVVFNIALIFTLLGFISFIGMIIALIIKIIF